MMLPLLLALTAPAAALDVTYWGVGASVGTMAIPTNYPVALPANAKDADGDAMVAKTKGDVELSLRGALYPTQSGRINARVDFGFAKDWGRQEFTFGYDHQLLREGDFHLLAGGGVGAGSERFGELGDGDGSLRVAYFPLRAQLSGLLRFPPKFAAEVSLYGTFHIVGEQAWYDSPDDTDPQTGSEAANPIFGGAGVAGATYAAVGAEATFWFGDWKAREPKPRGKKGGKKGGKGGGRA